MRTGRHLRKKSSSEGKAQASGRVNAAKKRSASLPPEGGKRMVLDCVLLTQRKRRFSVGDPQQDDKHKASDSRTSVPVVEPETPSENKARPKPPNKKLSTTQKPTQRARKRKRVSSPPAPPTSADAEAQPLESPRVEAGPSTTTPGPGMNDAQGLLTPKSPTDFVYKPQRRVSPRHPTPPSQNAVSAEVISDTATRPAKRPRKELQLATPPPTQQQQVVGHIVAPSSISSRPLSPPAPTLGPSPREDSIVEASVRDPSLLPEIPAKVNTPRVVRAEYEPPSPPSTSSSSHPTTTHQDPSYDASPADFELLDLPDTLILPWMATAVSYVDEGGNLQEQNVFLPPGVGCLVEAMKHTLSCERAALRNVEARYEQEVRKRFVAEHHVDVLTAENVRLRDALRRLRTDVGHRSPEV